MPRNWIMVGSITWTDGVATKTEIYEVIKTSPLHPKSGVLIRTTSYNSEGSSISSSTVFVEGILPQQFR